MASSAHIQLTPAPAGRFPALEHTTKLLSKLIPLLSTSSTPSSSKHVLLFVSHPTPYRNDTDRELPHRAESNFWWVSGCDVPNAAVSIEFSVDDAGSLKEGFKQTLWMPEVKEEDIMWSIPPPKLDTAQQLFVAHAYAPLGGLSSFLTSIDAGTTLVHTLPPTPLFPTLPVLSKSTMVDSTSLLTALHQARLTKDAYEVSLMQRACDITSQAHQTVMRSLGRFAAGRGIAGHGGRSESEGERGIVEDAGGWEIEGEGDAEALFVAACRRGGSKHLAYMPIIASGPRAATLHYICNHASFLPSTGALPTTLRSSAFQSTPHSHTSCAPEGDTHTHDPLQLGQKGDWKPQVLLIDAGTEYACYGADITRTMPVGNCGRFTPEARAIYSLVLSMQKHAESLCRAGVHWDVLQLESHKVLVRGLLELGIFKAEFGEEEILASGVSTGFFPHGLGHSIGLDVHDVPSASKPSVNTTLPPTSLENPQLYTYLRLRLPLEDGMLVTIEPGCYFSPHLLSPWRASKFIDQAKLATYEGVGGVRIEDVVLVETGGCRNLTKVVREVEDVERLCSGV